MNPKAEVIDDILYDCCRYQDTTTTTTELYQVPQSSNGNGLIGKTYFHTNMVQPGILANDESFKILGVAMALSPLISADADGVANAVYFQQTINGYAELIIGNKSYYQWPIWLLMQARIKSDVSPNLTSICNYFIESPHMSSKGFIPLIRPIWIPRGTQFRVKLTWSAAQAANATPFFTYFLLLGLRLRGVQ